MIASNDPAKLVKYRFCDGVAFATMARPHRLNAMVPRLVEDLELAFACAESDGARAFVLAGEGTSFCAGHDLKEPFEADVSKNRSAVARLQSLSERLLTSEIIVVSAVRGYALGGGFELALASDIVFADETAKFGLPEVERGLSITGGGSRALLQILGPIRAKRYMLSGEHIGAADAHRLGIVSQVVSAAELDSRVAEFAKQIVGRSRPAVAAAKSLIGAASDMNLREVLDAEAEYAVKTLSSPEASDSFASFSNKSPSSAIREKLAVSPHSLAAWVESAATKWRDKQALLIEATGESLTFGDLHMRSEKIADSLAALGILPGDRVGVMMGNVLDFPLIWLALAKIRASMVPINVFLQRNDAQYLVEHSGARLIIAEERFRPILTELRDHTKELEHVRYLGAPSGSVDSYDEMLARAAPERSRSMPLPQDITNIQYTSGTTGKPKGCLLTNRYWKEIAEAIGFDYARISAQDRLLTAQPFYYVDPQWNLAVVLLTGCSLVLLDRFHPTTFWEKVREHQVTYFYCLGVMPSLLLAMPPHPDDRNHRVREIGCSAIPRALHQKLEERWGVQWSEVFGMTETGSDIRVPQEARARLVGTNAIGWPYPHREVRIVDSEDRPLQVGQTGEIVMRGTGMMQGYFRNPEATAAVFRNGWMHTGDLGRMGEDGCIYYEGRAKEAIRRSGENISAVEVEEALAQHSSVRVAAVIGVPDEARGQEVKAFIQLKPDTAATAAELRAFCKERIAYYKVPRYWTFASELPRTPSERIAKGQLQSEEKYSSLPTEDLASGRHS